MATWVWSRHAPRNPMGPVSANIKFGLIFILFRTRKWQCSGHGDTVHIITGSKCCEYDPSINNTFNGLSMATWVWSWRAPCSPMCPVWVYTKFGLSLKSSRPGIWQGSGHCDPIHFKCTWRLKTEATISYTLIVFYSLTLGDLCGRLQDSTASSRRWLDTRVLSEVNANLSSFDADVDQLRDMALYGTIFYTSADLKFILHTVSKSSAKNGIHLPAETCKPSRQNRNIFHFNITPWLHNEFQIMLF